MSKRHSAKYQARIYKSLTPPLPKTEPQVTCEAPPRLIWRSDIKRVARDAEKEALRQRVRAVLAAEEASRPAVDERQG